MAALLSALGVLLAGGVLCVLVAHRPAFARWLGGLTGLGAGVLAVLSGIQVLCGRVSPDVTLAWSLPGAAITLQIDALSAFFVLVIGLVCGVSALYGVGYLESYQGHKNLGLTWFFYHLLFAGMLVVVTSRNAVLFLVAWEVMALASFFLVMFEHEQPGVTKAGWIYLAATHLGTAFLLALFVLLGKGSGSLDFADFRMPTAGVAGAAMFLLAVIGFGTKAGFAPMHVWLPEAHPAAPSFVSAVMSGVMIKTGIYGLLRVLTWVGPEGTIPMWWGMVLLGIGIVSGVMAIVFALAQQDLKRLLAYSSVENIGIIAIGLGLGMIGLASGHGTLAFLGLAGAVFHVLNHAVAKGLLFLGAGSVVHTCGTRRIDCLGGLLKRMPVTGAAFLIAATAICGLPGLNGFVGEVLLYMGAFSTLTGSHGLGMVLAGLVGIGGLCLIGGLAAACFTKAFGIVFLGEPRTSVATCAHESPKTMRVPMILLAGLCLGIALLAPLAFGLVHPVVTQLAGIGRSLLSDPTAQIQATRRLLYSVAMGGAVLLVLVLALAAIRRALLEARSVRQTGTWDCGYTAPGPRMQYTGSSFANPIVRLFGLAQGKTLDLRPPEGLFPGSAGLKTQVQDRFQRLLYRPALRVLCDLSGRWLWLQQGHIQMYVLYIAITVLVLLLWKLGVPS